MNHGKCCPSDTFCSLAQSKIEKDHIRVPFHTLPVLGNTLTLIFLSHVSRLTFKLKFYVTLFTLVTVVSFNLI